MSLANRSIRGLLYVSLSTLTSILSGFVVGILMARLLSPKDFGVFALAMTIAQFVDLRSKFYLGPYFIRDQSAGWEAWNTLFSLETLLSGASLALVVAAAAGAALLQQFELAVCLAAVGVLGLAAPAISAINLSIEKEVLFGRVALIQTVVGLAQSLTALGAALIGWGLWSLLLGQAVNTALSLLLYLRAAPRRPRWQLDRRLAREYLTYGVKYGLVFVTASVVVVQFDTLIVGVLGGTAAAGFYDRAYRTSLWPALLVSAAMSRISLPTYSKLQSDPPRLRRAFGLALWLVLTLTMPLGLYIALTAPDLVAVLYTDKWLPAVPILQMLAAFAVLRPLWDDLISILLATGRPGQMARVVFYQALAMVLLAVPLTAWLGGVGTAAAVGGVFSLSAGFLLYFAHRHLQVNLWEAAGWPALCNLLALGAYLGLRPMITALHLPTLWQWVALTALWFSLYGAISLLLRGRNLLEQLRYLLRAARA